MQSESVRRLLIGELAAQSGLTVRTLHHYDHLGLLRASGRSESGYRLFGPEDVERLYRIRALRSLGLSLAEIGPLLDEPHERGLRDVVERQLDEVRQQQVALRALERRLGLLLDTLETGESTNYDQLLLMIGEMKMLEHALRHDYAAQARRYDASRGVSPDVLRAITAAIAVAPGRTLLDVGGGTGNYAAALRDVGWSPTIVDASPEMRQAAELKGLATVAGDATHLPFADGTFDALTMISMLHQVADWKAAFAEAQRVLRADGVLAVMGLTADHLREVTWAFDLFPSMRSFALDRRPTLEQLQTQLPGCSTTPIWFSDLSDASIGALCAHPEAMLDEDRRRQTSFFERLERDNPDELRAGLRTLETWLASGRRPEQGRDEARQRLGDASVIVWRKRRPRN
jgi:DNA-binding transcriptional MerR regulator